MRRLVYVSGAPGAGKSSLAGPLAGVHCHCPAEVALARYSARMTHPVHVLKTLPAGAMAEYDRPVGIGGLVLVDTTAPVDVPAVAARVRACLADAASG